jgi:hypothetical protein
MAERKADILSCSFCGKSQDDVKKLVGGLSAHNCEGCVVICMEIINDDAQREAAATATEEGRGKKKEKKKDPKKGAATPEKKPDRRSRSTRGVHSLSSLIPNRSAIR